VECQAKRGVPRARRDGPMWIPSTLPDALWPLLSSLGTSSSSDSALPSSASTRTCLGQSSRGVEVEALPSLPTSLAALASPSSAAKVEDDGREAADGAEIPADGELEKWRRRLEIAFRSSTPTDTSRAQPDASFAPESDCEPGVVSWHLHMQAAQWEHAFKLELCSHEQECFETKLRQQGGRLEVLRDLLASANAERTEQRRRLLDSHDAVSSLLDTSMKVRQVAADAVAAALGCKGAFPAPTVPPAAVGTAMPEPFFRPRLAGSRTCLYVGDTREEGNDSKTMHVASCLDSNGRGSGGSASTAAPNSADSLQDGSGRGSGGSSRTNLTSGSYLDSSGRRSGGCSPCGVATISVGSGDLWGVDYSQGSSFGSDVRQLGKSLGRDSVGGTNARLDERSSSVEWPVPLSNLQKTPSFGRKCSPHATDTLQQFGEKSGLGTRSGRIISGSSQCSSRGSLVSSPRTASGAHPPLVVHSSAPPSYNFSADHARAAASLDCASARGSRVDTSETTRAALDPLASRVGVIGSRQPPGGSSCPWCPTTSTAAPSLDVWSESVSVGAAANA